MQVDPEIHQIEEKVLDTTKWLLMGIEMMKGQPDNRDSWMTLQMNLSQLISTAQALSLQILTRPIKP